MTSARRRASCMALAEWTAPAGLQIEWREAERERIAADPSAAPDGDPEAVSIGGCFHDDQDGMLPGETLNVFRAVTVTRGRDGERLVTTRRKFSGEGGFILARKIAQTRRLTTEAAALAWMQDGPHDVRPHLLLFHVGQVRSEIEPCVEYGMRYLRAWCERTGEPVRLDVIEAAAADALALVYWGRQTRGDDRRVPLVDRAKELRVRIGYLLMLRDVAQRAYRLRLAEAMILFEQAMGNDRERLTPAKRYPESRIQELPACNSDLARRAA